MKDRDVDASDLDEVSASDVWRKSEESEIRGSPWEISQPADTPPATTAGMYQSPRASGVIADAGGANMRSRWVSPRT